MRWGIAWSLALSLQLLGANAVRNLTFESADMTDHEKQVEEQEEKREEAEARGINLAKLGIDVPSISVPSISTPPAASAAAASAAAQISDISIFPQVAPTGAISLSSINVNSVLSSISNQLYVHNQI